MCIRYVFTHSCHHAGHGPILRCPYASSSIIPPQHKLTATSLSLPISCPFCNNPSLSCAPGAGVLTIMSTNIALRWEILRTCFIEELKSDDWKVGYNYMNGNWIPMAWIPRPGGIVTELHVAELQMLGLGGPWEWEGTEKIIRVESRWPHRGHRSARSRLPAMLSELRGRIGEEG